MSAPNPTAANSDETDSQDAWERALLDRQLEALGRLAAMGMDIAGDIHRRVTTCDDSAPVAELQHAAMDFSRVARAVRMTFALQSRLVTDFKARSQPASPEKTTSQVRWIGQLSPAEQARRSRLREVVRGVAEGEALDAETVERLVREAGERIEDDGVFGDIMARPFGEIVALIFRDVGLSPDWDSLAQEVWAQEERKAGARGSPFAAWTGGRTRPPPRAAEAEADAGPEGACNGTGGGSRLPLRSP